MQRLVHTRSNISALPGSHLFLLRLSPAQLACMSLCTEKARSNLSCECVLAESRGGLDTLEQSGCVIWRGRQGRKVRKKKDRREKNWRILLLCVSFFFSVMFWMDWLLRTSSSYWAGSMGDGCRFEGSWWSGSLPLSRTWWFYRLWNRFSHLILQPYGMAPADAFRPAFGKTIFSH